MRINMSVHEYSLANTDLKIEMKMNERIIFLFLKNFHIQCHPSVATLHEVAPSFQPTRKSSPENTGADAKANSVLDMQSQAMGGIGEG
jgi:hypothetical protein